LNGTTKAFNTASRRKKEARKNYQLPVISGEVSVQYSVTSIEEDGRRNLEK
jgi:hypothetical protein